MKEIRDSNLYLEDAFANVLPFLAKSRRGAQSPQFLHCANSNRSPISKELRLKSIRKAVCWCPKPLRCGLQGRWKGKAYSQTPPCVAEVCLEAHSEERALCSVCVCVFVAFRNCSILPHLSVLEDRNPSGLNPLPRCLKTQSRSRTDYLGAGVSGESVQLPVVVISCHQKGSSI